MIESHATAGRARFFSEGLFFFIILMVMLAGAVACAGSSEAADVNLDYPYSINLFSSQTPIDPTELPPASLFKGYRLYQTEYRGKGVLWHRLRLGFFPSRESAEKKLAELRDHFPRGWVARVSKEERLRSAGLVVTPGQPARGRRARAAQPAPRMARGKGLWALTLFISPRTPRPEDIPALPVFRKYNLYTATFRGKAKSWKVLRMGFFTTRDEAEKMRTALVETFPQAMVMQVPEGEKKVARKNALRPAGEVAEGASLGRKKVKLSKKKAKTVELMLKDAKKAMTRGKNRKAIAILSKVLKYPENKYSEEALELLGVAYERAGKESKAIAIYKEYLMFYPHGEGAKRVGQRLAGLETARARPRKSTLRKRRSREINELYGIPYSSFISLLRLFLSVLFLGLARAVSSPARRWPTRLAPSPWG